MSFEYEDELSTDLSLGFLSIVVGELGFDGSNMEPDDDEKCRTSRSTNPRASDATVDTEQYVTGEISLSLLIDGRVFI